MGNRWRRWRRSWRRRRRRRRPRSNRCSRYQYGTCEIRIRVQCPRKHRCRIETIASSGQFLSMYWCRRPEGDMCRMLLGNWPRPRDIHSSHWGRLCNSCTEPFDQCRQSRRTIARNRRQSRHQCRQSRTSRCSPHPSRGGKVGAVGAAAIAGRAGRSQCSRSRTRSPGTRSRGRRRHTWHQRPRCTSPSR